MSGMKKPEGLGEKKGLEQSKKISTYWETRKLLHLVIQGRVSPTSEELDLIYQMLDLHGINFEKEIKEGNQGK